MTWFKIDDGFWSHPKTMTLSDAAVALWTRAGAYSCQHLTDGHVAKSALRMLGDADAADELVDAGLWRTAGNGYAFHDWSDYQETRETVEARRKANRERQRRGRQSQRESRAIQAAESREVSRCDSRVTDGVSHGGGDTSGATWHDAGDDRGTAGAQPAPERESPSSQPCNATTSENANLSRRDSVVTDGVSHGGPDPTRPDPTYISGCVEREGSPNATRAPAPHCELHPDGTDAPCRACGAARERRRAWDAEQDRATKAEAAAERRRAADARRAEVAACRLCDADGYRLDSFGTSTTTVCDHDPDRESVNRAGMAKVRAALAGAEK